MHIRPAQLTDMESILGFCKELSSNFNEEVLKVSFPLILADKNAAVFVAALEQEPTGFIEVQLQCSLQSGVHAMIRALFVSERHRRVGHAQFLIQEAEAWAAQRGAEKILVQSKTERTVADKFYLGIGYTKFKVQNVYKKSLAT